jgi:hypothetical protein
MILKLRFYTSPNYLTLKINYTENIIHGLQETTFPTEAAAINPTSQQTTYYLQVATRNGLYTCLVYFTNKTAS